MRWLIAGGSGFLGRALVHILEKRGEEVSCLVRSPTQKGIFWDPPQGYSTLDLRKNFDVVVNLAGASLLGRWSASKRDEIRASRLETTRFLCRLLSQLENPPSLYLGASAIGYYGDRPNEVLTEKSPPGKGFLATLCKEWEAIPLDMLPSTTRRVALRFGVILSPSGGALKSWRALFKLGLGGCLGSGEAILSWIALEDALRIVFSLLDSSLSGPINCTSPHPLSNREMTQILGEVLRRPTFCTLPAWLLKFLLAGGEEPLLMSSYVVPERLLQAGFSFALPRFQDIAKKIL